MNPVAHESLLQAQRAGPPPQNDFFHPSALPQHFFLLLQNLKGEGKILERWNVTRLGVKGTLPYLISLAIQDFIHSYKKRRKN